ncbi:6132_t:CDS:10 [Entrophospora sp. SA101]|nr:6132_t:CDS:10 [Entrophospora sp. SA101]
MSGHRNRYRRRPNYQHRQYYHQIHHSQQNVQDSAKVSRINTSFSRLFEDTDPVYTRRQTNINQLLSTLSESCSAWEANQIFDFVTRESFGGLSGFESIFEDSRAPLSYKTTVAKCFAQIAVNLGNDIGFYFRWVFEHLQTSTASTKEKDKDRKSWILLSLREVFSRNSYGILQPSIAGLIHDLESLLDSMDSADCFPGILDVLEKIAEKYPTEFGERFQDIIDLLVGWYIDASISDVLNNLIADTFKRLRPIWLRQLNFAYDLMSHFLTDMEMLSKVNVSQEVPPIDIKSKSGNGEGEGIPNNLKSLLSCFHAVADAVSGILPSVSVNNLDIHIINDMSHPFDQLRSKAIKFITNIAELHEDQSWFEKGNQIILSLSTIRKPTFIKLQVLCTKFFLLQIKFDSKKELSLQCLDDWFDSFLQVLTLWTPYIHLEVILILADPESSLMKLRYFLSHRTQIHADIFDIIHTLFHNAVNIDFHLKQKENYLVNQLYVEIGSMLNILLHDSKKHAPKVSNWAKLMRSKELQNDNDKSLIQYLDSLRFLLNKNDYIIKDHIIDNRVATMIILFDIEILSEITCAQDHNNEVFWMIYLVLEKIGEHGQNYFINEEINHNNKLSSGFITMASIVNSFLQCPNELSSNALSLVLTWFQDVLTFSRSYQFHSLDIKFQIQSKLEPIFFTLVIMTSRVNDSDINVQNEFSKILFFINPFFATLKFEPVLDKFILTFKSNIASTHHQGIFRPPHFQIVMTYFGMKDLLTSQEEFDINNYDIGSKGSWKTRLFQSCQTIENFEKGIIVEENDDFKFEYSHTDVMAAIANSNELLTFWILWEVSRYCVLSRLRTPFGGPKQTFDAIEKKLNEFLEEDFNSIFDNSNTDPNIHDRFSRIYQLHDFLNLIDRLELQIYNAAVGTALGRLPQAPRASIIFFRTNRKVCDEWFSRVRTGIIKGAKIVGDDAMALKHGYQSLLNQINILKGEATVNRMELLMEFQETLMNIAWSQRILLNFENPDSGISSMINESSLEEKNHDNSTLQPSTASLVLLQRKPNNKTVPALAHFYWADGSCSFAEANYELSVKQSIESLNCLLEIDPEMQVTMPQLRFLTSQIINSYCKMDDFSSLGEWLDQNDIWEITMESLTESNKRYLEALADYNSGNYLPAWNLIENEQPKYHNNHDSIYFGPEFITNMSEFRRSLAKIVDSSPEDFNNDNLSISSVLEKLSKYSVEANTLFINSISLLAKTNCEIKDNEKYLIEFLDYVNFCQFSSFSTSFSGDLEIWSTLNKAVSRHLKQNGSLQSINNADLERNVAIFNLMTAKVARKSSAFKFSNSLLEHWKHERPVEVKFEIAKISFAMGNQQEAIRHLCTILRQKNKMESLNLISDSIVFCQKVYLKLSKWLQISGLQVGEEILSEMNFLLTEPTIKNTAKRGIIESCLSSAINYESSFDKAWFAYSTYNYQHGRQILDDLGNGKVTVNLLEVVCNEIKKIINEDLLLLKQENNNNLDWSIIFKSIFRFFFKKFGSQSKFDDNFVTGDGNAGTGSELLEILPEISDESITSIMIILGNLHQDLITFYKNAVEGYFKYLQLADNKRVFDTNFNNEDNRNKKSDITTATLRLLRLLVKHGGYLETQFVKGFNNTSIKVWENIIPQLFSRLDHPNVFVQQQLCKLLCTIAANSPQLVVYHTIVAFSSSGTSDLNKQLLKKIAESLDKTNGLLFAQIQRVIKELKQITVLWEELWHNKISGLQLDVNKRLHKIENEFERINDNLSLTSDQKIKFMKESYDVTMKPVIVAIERLYNSTIVVASTPHEKWFCESYGIRIHKAFEKLRTPMSWDTIKDGWNFFRKLQTSRTLKLAEVSPFLSTINSSLIDMPGLPTYSDHVTIQSFDENIIILPTKTKPKKLNLYGSDGRQYGYLFKGLEDLHLDERMMQLLQITNGLFLRDKQSCNRHLNARHYAVIPLGDHSGMIQLVENATQMFVLYKRWQHREHFAKVLQNSNNEDSVENPQRPSDIFFEKISKGLKKEGFPISTSRRNWPHSVLKSIFLELVAETPSDLLEKEIWSSCTSSAEWWYKSLSMSRSLAVMSVIGYIIGLGDRHLDNILIDFDAGEVIHIDYNVCFEKGRKLRIPEMVPFRLTQNIVAALGVTGVDGVFRIACENVLRVMRKNKEMLLILLEAFVYDPLVDWHQGESDNSQSNENDQIAGKRTSSGLGIIEEDVEGWDNPFQQIQSGKNIGAVRNTFAVSVIRRIKSKLEGKDFDSATKMTVSDQVDIIIKQAMDIDNLCVMYEGWTSWI